MRGQREQARRCHRPRSIGSPGRRPQRGQWDGFGRRRLRHRLRPGFSECEEGDLNPPSTTENRGKSTGRSARRCAVARPLVPTQRLSWSLIGGGLRLRHEVRDRHRGPFADDPLSAIGVAGTRCSCRAGAWCQRRSGSERTEADAGRFNGSPFSWRRDLADLRRCQGTRSTPLRVGERCSPLDATSRFSGGSVRPPGPFQGRRRRRLVRGRGRRRSAISTLVIGLRARVSA